MTNRSNDDIANALRGLASGEHAESEHDADAAHAVPPPQPAPAPQALPTQPAYPVPPRAGPVRRPAGAVPPQPMGGAPVRPKPAAPARPARPVEPGAAPAPQRPAAPGSVGPARPVAPATPPVVPIVPVQSGFVAAEQATAYDDDAVIMPAPPPQYLAHVTHAPAHPKRPPLGRSTTFRNTLIPVLFTSAALLVTAAVMKYFVHPDAPLAAMPTWLAVVLAGGGIGLAAVAVLYLLQLQRPVSAEGASGSARSRIK